MVQMESQITRLTAHLNVPSVYTSLARASTRKYPMTILKEAESAAAAASKLFRMPVPTNEYEGISPPWR